MIKKFLIFLLCINTLALNTFPLFAEEDENNFVAGVYDIDIDTSRYVTTEEDTSSQYGRDMANESLPSYYNLVDLGYVTSVKNQGNYGTCWAHAILASAESTSIIDGELTKDANLSEVNLAYFEYNNHYADNLNLITEDYSYGSNTGDGTESGVFNQGGNLAVATMNLPSGIGISNESRLPYSVLPSKSSNFKRAEFDSTYITGHESWCYDNDYRVINVEQVSASDIQGIKKLLMNEGAVGVSYYSDDDSYFNEDNNAYYNYYTKSTNHAVTIVGWDDNFSRKNFGSSFFSRPSKDGAWIIKNSWGKSYGNAGYFYLSYYDVGLNTSMACLFDIEATTKDDRIYQYDGTFSYSEVSISSSSHYESNIYTAQREEYVHRVGFYTTGANVDYVASVYKGLSNKNNPTSGTLVTQVSGTCTYGGYHSVDLTNPVFLNSGDTFSVVVKFSGDNSKNYYFDNSISGSWHFTNSSFSSGQSYFSYDGSSWTDTATRSTGVGNLRIKAYTNSTFINSDNTYCSYDETKGLTFNSASSSLINQINSFTIDDVLFAGTGDLNSIFISNAELRSAGLKSGIHTIKIQTAYGYHKSFTLDMDCELIDYTITYHLDESINSIKNPSTYNKETESFVFENPTKKDYVFLGWFLESTFVRQIQGVSKGSKGNLDLYAKFRKMTDEEIVNNIAVLDSMSAVLSEKIGFDIYVDVKDIEQLNAVEFHYSMDDQNETSFLVSTFNKNKDGKYISSIALDANKTNSVLKAWIVVNSKCGTVQTITIDSYCKDAMNQTTDQKTIDLLNSVREYGAYASYYFNNNTSQPLLTNDYSNELASYVQKIILGGRKSTVQLTNASLILDSTTSMKIYFKINSNYDVSNFNFVVDGIDSSRLLINNDSITITDIKASELMNSYHLTISFKSNDEKVIDMIYSPMSYVEQVLKLKGDQYINLKNLMIKLYEYGLNAKTN